MKQEQKKRDITLVMNDIGNIWTKERVTSNLPRTK